MIIISVFRIPCPLLSNHGSVSSDHLTQSLNWSTFFNFSMIHQHCAGRYIRVLFIILFFEIIRVVLFHVSSHFLVDLTVRVLVLILLIFTFMFILLIG